MALEKLYTIEVNDAVREDTECPFCYLEAQLEQKALDFTLGSSYMESDIREQTDHMGFCREHIIKMYQYGNALGNGWIMKSRLEELRKQYDTFYENYSRQSGKKSGLLAKIQKKSGVESIKYTEDHCFVCQRIKKDYHRMVESFVYLMITDEGFIEEIKGSKGYCMRHFPDLIEVCENKLSMQEQQTYIPQLFDIMKQNLDRLQEEIDWMIEKYDYRNKDADWKNSRDALPRVMEKINGLTIHLTTKK